MSKITKKQLQRDIELLESGIGMNWSDMKKIETRLNHAMNEMAQQLEALEEFATYADNMLTELNHALPDPEYDAKCEAEAADIDASLDRHRERLGLNKPQLKQLDQSVFKEWADCWKFFAIDEDGDAWRYREKPKIDNGDNRWSSSNTVPLLIGEGYDASNWQNSLIERDIAKELLEVDLSSELTGSELCRAMLARGDKYVMCRTIGGVDVISGTYEDGYFVSLNGEYEAVAPINNQGEPLTAAEAGF